MGKLVTFWSPFPGQAKVTSSMCAVCGMWGMQYSEMEIAIAHRTCGIGNLEEKFDFKSETEGKIELLENSGLAALTVHCMQTALTSEKIRRCAIPLRIQSLFLFPSGGLKEEENTIYMLLTEYIKQEFSAVFLDLESGWKKETVRYLDASDLIVVVLPQNPLCWEQYFTEEVNTFTEKNVVYLIGGYLEKSRYNTKLFLKKRKGNVQGTLAGVIPMNVGFLDAMADGRTLDFLLRNQLSKKNEENYEFILETKKATERIKKKLFPT